MGELPRQRLCVCVCFFPVLACVRWCSRRTACANVRLWMGCLGWLFDWLVGLVCRQVIFLESNEDNEGVVRVPKSIMKRLVVVLVLAACMPAWVWLWLWLCSFFVK